MYDKRKLYVNDLQSGSFQIVKLDKNFKFISSPPNSYSSLKNVWNVYRLKSCVLIHMQDDMLYLTDTRGSDIKCSIKYLFEGWSFKDRGNPNKLYIRANDSVYLRQLNLFNDSPVSIPYQLLIKHNLYSQYDAKTNIISYYESID